MVARGTDSSNGCQGAAFGAYTSDINSNSRYSLGDDVINTVCFECGCRPFSNPFYVSLLCVNTLDCGWW